MDKKHLERILTVNGASLESSEAEIRSILERARYSANELTMAMQVLLGSVSSTIITSGEVSKIFRSDEVLTTSEISSLLGIEMNSTKKIPNKVFLKRQFGTMYVMLIIFLALLLGLGGIMGLMYVFEYGIFYSSSALNVL